MNDGRWSLDALYTGLDDPRFAADKDLLTKTLKDYAALAAEADALPDRELLLRTAELRECLEDTANRLFAYCALRRSANTRDTDAVSALGRLQRLMSEAAAPEALLDKRIGDIAELDAVVAEDPVLESYRYYFSCIQRDGRYLLAPNEENILSKLNMSGGSAWSQLRDSLSASVTGEFRGEKLGLSALRNLAYDADSAVRREAYDAELAVYPKFADSGSYALNSIKLQVLTESSLRGYDSPLQRTLHGARMQQQTLDALLGAIREYLPRFWDYLRAKGRALGHANGLPWWDLFAPMGSSEQKYDVGASKKVLVDTFTPFDPDLGKLMQRAFDESWIDFYPREGKVGGAFCMSIHCLGQSRILTNFDGSFSDIVTLAHELGHAYHNLNLLQHRPLNTSYSMPVAETASTFNENVLLNAAIRSASTKAQKLALIEGQLSDATQIICDILSRYLFEKGVFEARENEFMPAERLCERMHAAQREAYGDGVDESTLHPYMWLCKGHYYSTGRSYYNFPYAFGGLFARGLYARYEQEGAAFVPKYRRLLAATTVMDVEDCAKIADIDLTTPAFWREALQSLSNEIDEFIALVQ